MRVPSITRCPRKKCAAGCANAVTNWPIISPAAGAGRNRLAGSGPDVAGRGQGQTVAVEIEESRVVIDIQLPAALSFMEPIVAGAVRDRGQNFSLRINISQYISEVRLAYRGL